jgi:hypothetical protein
LKLLAAESKCLGQPAAAIFDRIREFFARASRARLELYLSDQLHLRPAAYDKLTRILKPVLMTTFGTP